MFLFGAVPLFGDEAALTESLRKAINSGNNAEAERLLEAGADPDGLYYEDQTFLMKAFSRTDFELAGLLLDRGADPDIRDSGGRSAVFYMILAKVLPWEIIEFAESRGLRFDVIDNDGASPLMYEIGNHEALLADALLNWEEKYSPNFSAGRKSRKDYYTALLGWHLGGKNYAYPFLDRLLEAGASADARDKDGVPAVLHIAWLSSRDTALVRRFVDLGAPVNEFDKRGYSLLIYALSRSDDEMTEFLLRRGAQANQQNKDGKTALMFAKTERAVSLLLEAGADAAHTDNAGNTALHNWYALGNKQILEMLLAAGCPLDAPNLYGFTPLLNAARKGEGREVRALVEKGADPNRKDTDGQSVLLHYIRSGDKATQPVVALLLAAGARPADKDNEGVSALLYALRQSESRWADNAEEMGIFCGMMREHMSEEEIEADEDIVAAEGRERFFGILSRNSGVLTSLFLLGGLSVTMRELAFRDNKSGNFMGAVNGMLTLGGAGLFLGGAIGTGPGGLDRLGTGLGGAFLGAAGGIVVACLPPVRKAFAENAPLYYIPAAAGLLVTFTILLD